MYDAKKIKEAVDAVCSSIVKQERERKLQSYIPPGMNWTNKKGQA